ncbi:Fungal Zn(2)-Cys(6) binuclear cluster domain [Ceratobasidium sp. AG-Ba]|nr:Fungal Zn(2)-Cys(6) binuclear cluster domain [Ceratobasidium sp. AG-Ba]
MSDQQPRAGAQRSIMPAVDNVVRKRERESETIESPDDSASNGLPTPNGAGPSTSNGNGISNGNGNGAAPPASDAADKPVKPHKPLNRVPRACNACRKQKMRCEGADNPPCKRCRHAHIECMFEKPAREVSAATEQGLERIRSLETQVTSIQHTLSELVSAIRSQHTPQQQQPAPPQTHSTSAPSPSSATTGSTQTPQIHPSPSPYSPSLNATTGYPAFHPPMALPPQMMQQHYSHHHSHSHHGSEPNDRDMAAATALAMAQRGHHPNHNHQTQQRYNSNSSSNTNTNGNGYDTSENGTTLPPFSALNNMTMPPPPGRQTQQGSYNSYSNRSPDQGQSPQRSGSKPTPSQHGSFHSDSGSYHSHHHHNQQQQHHQQQYSQHHQQHQLQYPSDHYQHQQHLHPPHPLPPPPQQHQRHSTVVPSSNVTSADSSDDEGELPTHGLVAPIEVLRGLAERQEREMGGQTRSPSPAASTPAPPARRPLTGGSGAGPSNGTSKDDDRPTKRRKTRHFDEQSAPDHAFPDVVTKGIISEQEARELFAIFYRGCSTFLPVFDMAVDTYDALHLRSPFCVNTICMVAARVRDGGDSDTYQKCRAEVEEISRHTLFTPVARQEAVQAMVLVSGWSSNGWLPGGHAVRMGLEIGMHKAWPRLFKRMRQGKLLVTQEERQLVISARTWFVLFLFEHQISFGTGRPAILREDESIARCRMILQHPLSIQDDMRLVSMVELMVLREQIHNQLAPYEGPVDDRVYKVLHQAESDFRAWYEEWDHMFSQKYEDAAFYRQSLMIQRDFGELYHNATALRGVRGPEDVSRMPPEQKLVAQRAIKLAKRGLDNCIRSVTYREGLKYAVHFTHVSATFAASFLIRLARLFPQDCDPNAIMSTVEDLVHLLSNIPAGRYARSLRLMLRSARRRRVLPPRPAGPVDRAGNPPVLFGTPPQGTYMDTNSPQQFVGASPGTHGESSVSPHAAFNLMSSNGMVGPGQEFDPYLQGFELAPGQEVPVWLSESSLGDAALSQFGLEAFVIPQQYDPNSTETQIW